MDFLPSGAPGIEAEVRVRGHLMTFRLLRGGGVVDQQNSAVGILHPHQSASKPFVPLDEFELKRLQNCTAARGL